MVSGADAPSMSTNSRHSSNSSKLGHSKDAAAAAVGREDVEAWKAAMGRIYRVWPSFSANLEDQIDKVRVYKRPAGPKAGQEDIYWRTLDGSWHRSVNALRQALETASAAVTAPPPAARPAPPPPNTTTNTTPGGIPVSFTPDDAVLWQKMIDYVRKRWPSFSSDQAAVISDGKMSVRQTGRDAGREEWQYKLLGSEQWIRSVTELMNRLEGQTAAAATGNGYPLAPAAAMDGDHLQQIRQQGGNQISKQPEQPWQQQHQHDNRSSPGSNGDNQQTSNISNERPRRLAAAASNDPDTNRLTEAAGCAGQSGTAGVGLQPPRAALIPLDTTAYKHSTLYARFKKQQQQKQSSKQERPSSRLGHLRTDPIAQQHQMSNRAATAAAAAAADGEVNTTTPVSLEQDHTGLGGRNSGVAQAAADGNASRSHKHGRCDSMPEPWLQPDADHEKHDHENGGHDGANRGAGDRKRRRLQVAAVAAVPNPVSGEIDDFHHQRSQHATDDLAAAAAAAAASSAEVRRRQLPRPSVHVEAAAAGVDRQRPQQQQLQQQKEQATAAIAVDDSDNEEQYLQQLMQQDDHPLSSIQHAAAAAAEDAVDEDEHYLQRLMLASSLNTDQQQQQPDSPLSVTQQETPGTRQDSRKRTREEHQQQPQKHRRPQLAEQESVSQQAKIKKTSGLGQDELSDRKKKGVPQQQQQQQRQRSRPAGQESVSQQDRREKGSGLGRDKPSEKKASMFHPQQQQLERSERHRGADDHHSHDRDKHQQRSQPKLQSHRSTLTFEEREQLRRHQGESNSPSQRHTRIADGSKTAERDRSKAADHDGRDRSAANDRDRAVRRGEGGDGDGGGNNKKTTGSKLQQGGSRGPAAAAADADHRDHADREGRERHDKSGRHPGASPSHLSNDANKKQEKLQQQQQQQGTAACGPVPSDAEVFHLRAEHQRLLKVNRNERDHVAKLQQQVHRLRQELQQQDIENQSLRQRLNEVQHLQGLLALLAEPELQQHHVTSRSTNHHHQHHHHHQQQHHERLWPPTSQW